MLEYSPVIQPLISGPDLVMEVLRLDLLHPEISGNKWFKLKHNILAMHHAGSSGMLTFGGAHSNHIAAVAAAGRYLGFATSGIIRGEKPVMESDTVRKARSDGMDIVYVERQVYRENCRKSGPDAMLPYKDWFVVPEGGANAEGIRGAGEIMQGLPHYDYVMCACGTGTTYTGLLSSVSKTTKVIGISVLKGENTMGAELLEQTGNEVLKSAGGNEWAAELPIQKNFITNAYAGTGYAAFDSGLVRFKKDFEAHYRLPLDYVYTAKLFRAALDMAGRNCFRAGSKVLLVHSGGLQGNSAFERRYNLQ